MVSGELTKAAIDLPWMGLAGSWTCIVACIVAGEGCDVVTIPVVVREVEKLG